MCVVLRLAKDVVPYSPRLVPYLVRVIYTCFRYIFGVHNRNWNFVRKKSAIIIKYIRTINAVMYVLLIERILRSLLEPLKSMPPSDLNISRPREKKGICHSLDISQLRKI